jgi:hypothetical protein
MVMVPHCVEAHSHNLYRWQLADYVTRTTSFIVEHVVICSTGSNTVFLGKLTIVQLGHSPSLTEPDSITLFTRTPVLIQGSSLPCSQVLPSPHRPQPHEFIGNLFLCNPFLTLSSCLCLGLAHSPCVLRTC